MNNEVTTIDLANFGYREIAITKDILTAWVAGGLPEDFSDSEVTIMFNRNSGSVFLTNSDYQVAMVVDGKLESFYSCPQCGNEGFEGEYPFSECGGYCSKECEDENI